MQGVGKRKFPSRRRSRSKAKLDSESQIPISDSGSDPGSLFVRNISCASDLENGIRTEPIELIKTESMPQVDVLRDSMMLVKESADKLQQDTGADNSLQDKLSSRSLQYSRFRRSKSAIKTASKDDSIDDVEDMNRLDTKINKGKIRIKGARRNNTSTNNETSAEDSFIGEESGGEESGAEDENIFEGKSYEQHRSSKGSVSDKDANIISSQQQINIDLMELKELSAMLGEINISEHPPHDDCNKEHSEITSQDELESGLKMEGGSSKCKDGAADNVFEGKERLGRKEKSDQENEVWLSNIKSRSESDGILSSKENDLPESRCDSKSSVTNLEISQNPESNTKVVPPEIEDSDSFDNCTLDTKINLGKGRIRKARKQGTGKVDANDLEDHSDDSNEVQRRINKDLLELEVLGVMLEEADNYKDQAHNAEKHPKIISQDKIKSGLKMEADKSKCEDGATDKAVEGKESLPISDSKDKSDEENEVWLSNIESCSASDGVLSNEENDRSESRSGSNSSVTNLEISQNPKSNTRVGPPEIDDSNSSDDCTLNAKINQGKGRIRKARKHGAKKIDSNDLEEHEKSDDSHNSHNVQHQINKDLFKLEELNAMLEESDVRQNDIIEDKKVSSDEKEVWLSSIDSQSAGREDISDENDCAKSGIGLTSFRANSGSLYRITEDLKKNVSDPEVEYLDGNDPTLDTKINKGKGFDEAETSNQAQCQIESDMLKLEELNTMLEENDVSKHKMAPTIIPVDEEIENSKSKEANQVLKDETLLSIKDRKKRTDENELVWFSSIGRLSASEENSSNENERAQSDFGLSCSRKSSETNGITEKRKKDVSSKIDDSDSNDDSNLDTMINKGKGKIRKARAKGGMNADSNNTSGKVDASVLAQGRIDSDLFELKKLNAMLGENYLSENEILPTATHTFEVESNTKLAIRNSKSTNARHVLVEDETKLYGIEDKRVSIDENEVWLSSIDSQSAGREESSDENECDKSDIGLTSFRANSRSSIITEDLKKNVSDPEVDDLDSNCNSTVDIKINQGKEKIKNARKHSGINAESYESSDKVGTSSQAQHSSIGIASNAEKTEIWLNSIDSVSSIFSNGDSCEHLEGNVNSPEKSESAKGGMTVKDSDTFKILKPLLNSGQEIARKLRSKIDGDLKHQHVLNQRESLKIPGEIESRNYDHHGIDKDLQEMEKLIALIRENDSDGEQLCDEMAADETELNFETSSENDAHPLEMVEKVSKSKTKVQLSEVTNNSTNAEEIELDLNSVATTGILHEGDKCASSVDCLTSNSGSCHEKKFDNSFEEKRYLSSSRFLSSLLDGYNTSVHEEGTGICNKSDVRVLGNEAVRLSKGESDRRVHDRKRQSIHNDLQELQAMNNLLHQYLSEKSDSESEFDSICSKISQKSAALDSIMQETDNNSSLSENGTEKESEFSSSWMSFETSQASDEEMFSIAISDVLPVAIETDKPSTNLIPSDNILRSYEATPDVARAESSLDASERGCNSSFNFQGEQTVQVGSAQVGLNTAYLSETSRTSAVQTTCHQSERHFLKPQKQEFHGHVAEMRKFLEQDHQTSSTLDNNKDIVTGNESCISFGSDQEQGRVSSDERKITSHEEQAESCKLVNDRSYDSQTIPSGNRLHSKFTPSRGEMSVENILGKDVGLLQKPASVETRGTDTDLVCSVTDNTYQDGSNSQCYHFSLQKEETSGQNYVHCKKEKPFYPSFNEMRENTSVIDKISKRVQKSEELDQQVREISTKQMAKPNCVIKDLDSDGDVVDRHSDSPCVPDQENSDRNNFTTEDEGSSTAGAELGLSAISFGSTSSQHNSDCLTTPEQMQLESTLVKSTPHPKKEGFGKDAIELCVSEISFESTSCVNSELQYDLCQIGRASSLTSINNVNAPGTNFLGTDKKSKLPRELEEFDECLKESSNKQVSKSNCVIHNLDLDGDVVDRHSKSPCVPDQENSDRNNFTAENEGSSTAGAELGLSALSFGSTSSQGNLECPATPKQMQLEGTSVQSIASPRKDRIEKDGIYLCVSEISFESTHSAESELLNDSKSLEFVNEYKHTEIELTDNSDDSRVTDSLKNDDKASKLNSPSSSISIDNSDVNAPGTNFSSTDKKSKLPREMEEFDDCLKESSNKQVSKSICAIKGLDSDGNVVQRHSKSPSVSDQVSQANPSWNDLTMECEDLSSVGLEIGISAMSFGNTSCQSNSECFKMPLQMQSNGSFVESITSPEHEKFKSQANGIELCASEISFERSATNVDSERSNDLRNPESHMSPRTPVEGSSSIPQMVPDLQINSVIRCESEETIVEQLSAKRSSINLEQKMRDLKKKLNVGKSFPNLLKTSDKEPIEVDKQLFIQYFGSKYCSDNQGPESLTTEFSPVVRSKSLISLSSDSCDDNEVLESCEDVDTQNSTTNELLVLLPKSRTMTLENSLMDIEYLKFMANINDGLDYVSEDLQTVRDYQNHLMNQSSAENSSILLNETTELAEIKKVLEGIEIEASKIKRMQRKMLINAQNIENQHLNSCSSTVSPSTSMDSVILNNELVLKSSHEQITSTDVFDLKSSTVTQVITDYEGLLQDLRSPEVTEEFFREKYDFSKSELHSLGKEKDILRKIFQFKTIKSLVDQVEKTTTIDASLIKTGESSLTSQLQDQLTLLKTRDKAVNESSCTVDTFNENALMEWTAEHQDEVITFRNSEHKDTGCGDDSIIEIIEKEVGDDRDSNSMSDEPHSTVQRAVDMYEQMLTHLNNPEFSERYFNKLYDLSKEQMRSFINQHNIAADNWRSTVEDKNFGDTTVMQNKSRRSVWEGFKRIAKKSIRSPEKRTRKSREKMKSGSLDSLINVKTKSRPLWDQIKSVTRNTSVQSTGCDPKLVEDKCNETELEVCNVETQVSDTHLNNLCKNGEQMERKYSTAGREKNPYLDMTALREHMAESAENDPVVREIDREPPTVKRSYYDIRQKISSIFRRNSCSPEQNKLILEAENVTPRSDVIDGLSPISSFHDFLDETNLYEDQGLMYKGDTSIIESVDPPDKTPSFVVTRHVEPNTNNDFIANNGNQASNINLEYDDAQSNKKLVDAFSQWSSQWSSHESLESMYSVAGRDKNPYLDISGLRKHMAENAENEPVVREIDENPPIVKKSYNDVRNKISTVFRRNAELHAGNDQQSDETKEFSINENDNVFLFPYHDFESNRIVQDLADDRDDENSSNEVNAVLNPTVVQNPSDQVDLAQLSSSGNVKLAVNEMINAREHTSSEEECANLQVISKDVKSIDTQISGTYFKFNDGRVMERTYSTAGREKNPYLDMNALREHMAETAEDGPVVREIDENPPVVEKSYKNVRNKISTVFRQNAIADHNNHQVEQRDTEQQISQEGKCDNMRMIVPDISHTPELLETEVFPVYDESDNSQNISPPPEFGSNNLVQVVDDKSSLKEADIINNMTINEAAQSSAYQSDCAQPTCGGEVEPKSIENIFEGVKVFVTDVNNKSEFLGSREDNRGYNGNSFVHSEYLSTEADQMNGPRPVKTENQDVVRVLKSQSFSAIPEDKHDVNIKRGSKSLYNLDASCCDDCGNIAITATVESDDVVELEDLINVLEDCKSLLPDHFPCQIETCSQSSEISIKTLKPQSSATKIDVEAFIENVITSAVEKAEVCMEESPSGTETVDKKSSWAVEDKTDINLNYHNSLASIAKRLSCSLKETFEEIADDGITFDTHGFAENDISDVCSEDFSLDVPLLAHSSPTANVNSDGDSISISMANTPEQLESPRIITASNAFEQLFENQTTGSDDDTAEAETAPLQSRNTYYSESETREPLTTVGNSEFSDNFQTAGPSRLPEELAQEVPQYSEMRRITVSLQPTMVQKDLLAELGKHLKAREDHITEDPLTVERDSPSNARQLTEDPKAGQSGSPRKRKLSKIGKVFRNRKVFKFCSCCKSKCKQRIRAFRNREKPSSQ